MLANNIIEKTQLKTAPLSNITKYLTNDLNYPRCAI